MHNCKKEAYLQDINKILPFFSKFSKKVFLFLQEYGIIDA